MDGGSFSVNGDELPVKSIKSLTDQLIGSIKLDDQKLIEDIIESEDSVISSPDLLCAPTQKS